MFALDVIVVAQLLRNPLAEYGLALALAVSLLFWGFLKFWSLLKEGFIVNGA